MDNQSIQECTTYLIFPNLYALKKNKYIAIPYNFDK